KRQGGNMTGDSSSVRRLFVPKVFGVVAVTSALLSAVGFAAFSPTAQSTPEYLGQFNSKYKTSGGKLDSCSTCHRAGEGPSKETLNPYGTDFGAANHDFAAVEAKDSDGDGVSNIDEINGGSFPGDPADKPTAAQEKPAPTTSSTTTTTAGPLSAITDLLGL
ncbi:MAG TPA: hypothetical protein VFS16_19350, partial [Acidimicrobiia bacterium]|nr:hypothetical protein [Acidimicrobiia bacterium]